MIIYIIASEYYTTEAKFKIQQKDINNRKGQECELENPLTKLRIFFS